MELSAKPPLCRLKQVPSITGLKSSDRESRFGEVLGDSLDVLPQENNVCALHTLGVPGRLGRIPLLFSCFDFVSSMRFWIGGSDDCKSVSLRHCRQFRRLANGNLDGLKLSMSKSGYRSPQK